jgi:hypothetical protein
VPSTLTNLLRPAALLAALAVTASGCSYFRGTKKLDMQPFAENTVTSIGELRKIEAPPVWIRLRPYFAHPAVLEARATAKPLLNLVRGVNIYSLQLVSLNESRVADPAKSRELASFLHGASQQALMSEADRAEIALTPERRDAILKDIASKERYMDALMAAEPIVNAVTARGLELSDNVDAAIMRAIAAIEGEVQGQYKAMLANRSALLLLQERTILAQTWAEVLAFGDEAAADQLRKTVPVVAEYVPAGRKPGAKEQQAAVSALAAQAARIKAALDQIEPEYQAYRESVLELDQLRAKTTENAKMARSVLMLWSRSHKNLARGVEVPPMFDLAKIVMGAGSSAAKGVLPF